MPPTDKLEAETRIEIDAKLKAAGWIIQNKNAINIFTGTPSIHGIAIREMDTGSGKTYAVGTQAIPLAKFAKVKRVQVVATLPPFAEFRTSPRMYINIFKEIKVER